MFKKSFISSKNSDWGLVFDSQLFCVFLQVVGELDNFDFKSQENADLAQRE
jgi:hypothetical protein